jgi:ABC-type uncharacterized transport system fused permease/ATPase subunit
MDVDSKVFFLPQRPYMVLGTLRQQLLYPTWNEEDSERSAHSSDSSGTITSICIYVCINCVPVHLN